ncbi:MAG: hypothetical protein ACTSWC_06600 [Promethearchaeota archaeon]
MMKYNYLGQGILHKDKVRHLLFSDDGHFCYSAGWDKTIVKWNIKQIKDQNIYPEWRFWGHNAPVSAIVIIFPESLLISGDKKGFLFVWDTNKGNLILQTKTLHPKITALTVSKEFTSNLPIKFYSGGSDGKITLWELFRNLEIANKPWNIRKIKIFSGPSQPIHQIREDLIHNRLICSGDESLVYIWDIGKHESPPITLSYPEKIIFSFDLAISKDMGLILCGGQKKALYLIEYIQNTPAILLDRVKTSAPISFIRYNPETQQWLVCDFKGCFSIYSIKNEKILKENDFILENLQNMLFIGLNRDWRYLAVSSCSDLTHQIQFFRQLN